MRNEKTFAKNVIRLANERFLPMYGARMRIYHDRKNSSIICGIIVNSQPVGASIPLRDYIQTDNGENAMIDRMGTLLARMEKATIGLTKENIASRIVFRMESPAVAEVLTQTCPSVPFLEEKPDMPRLFFRYVAESDGERVSTMMIDNAIMERFGFTIEQLTEHAEANWKMFSPHIINAEWLLTDSTAPDKPWDGRLPCLLSDDKQPVSSTLLANRKVLEKIAKRANVEKLAILPADPNFIVCMETRRNIPLKQQARLFLTMLGHTGRFSPKKRLYNGMFCYDRQTGELTAIDAS